MNPTYPLLRCPKPEFFDRTPLTPSFVPPNQDVMREREQIAARLLSQVSKLSVERKNMTVEERRAVFYKLKHERPIATSGTGLQIVCTSPAFSFAIVDDNESDLQKIEQKISAFGKGSDEEAKKSYSLAAPLQEFSTGEPKDRLSEPLFEQYDKLIISKDLLVLEIEIMVPEISNPSEIRSALQKIRQEIGWCPKIVVLKILLPPVKGCK